MEHDCLTPIGQMAIFYVPHSKLQQKYPVGAILKTLRKIFHDFFIENYKAYTLDIHESIGFWCQEQKEIQDQLARYEVSFEGKVEEFIDFLAEICELIGEECIYLTMGRHSYLVKPKSTHTEQK